MRLSLEARAYFSKAEQLRQQAAMKSVMRDLAEMFSQMDFIPYGYCYSWNSSLIWTHALADALIGISFVSIVILLAASIKKIKDVDISTGIILFGITMGAAALTFFMDVWSIWNSSHWIEAGVKVFTALFSILTAIYLFKLRAKFQKLIEFVKATE